MIIQADAFDKFVLMLPEDELKMTDCAVTVRCSSSCSRLSSYNNICLDLPNEYTIRSQKISIIVTFESPEELIVVPDLAVTTIYVLGSSQ